MWSTSYSSLQSPVSQSAIHHHFCQLSPIDSTTRSRHLSLNFKWNAAIWSFWSKNEESIHQDFRHQRGLSSSPKMKAVRTYSLTGEELSKSVWSTAIGEHKAKQDLFSLACQPIHSFSYKVNRVRKLIFCKLAHIHIVYIEVIGLETNVWKAKGNSESSKICLMTNLWESLDPILAPTSVNWYLMKKNRMRTMRSKKERLKVIVTLLFGCHFGQNNNTCVRKD